MSQIPELLRSKGLKVTPQRIAILNMLMSTKEHPTAEANFKALEPTNPTMSLATVYKTLDSFTELGLVQELSIDGESLHYDYTTEFHPHIICRKCGCVIDVDIDVTNELNEIVNKITASTSHNIDKEQLFFYGICEKCK